MSSAPFLPSNPQDFPPQLGLQGAHLEPNNLGHSQARVWRVSWPDGRQAYLKAQPLSQAVETGESLQRDSQLLSWLQGKVPVPQVLAYTQMQTKVEGIWQTGEYLLMTALPGQPASDAVFRQDPEQLVRLLAQSLRQLHALPLKDCPFDLRLPQKLALAQANLSAGRVDESDFESSRQGLRAGEVYQQLLSSLPTEPEDLVFTHGDACLPNFLIQQGQLQGFIDIGRAGIADRWQDLALLLRSLDHNGLGPEYQTLCLEAYGETLHQAKRDFYTLLDEFF